MVDSALGRERRIFVSCYCEVILDFYCVYGTIKMLYMNNKDDS